MVSREFKIHARWIVRGLPCETVRGRCACDGQCCRGRRRSVRGVPDAPSHGMRARGGLRALQQMPGRRSSRDRPEVTGRALYPTSVPSPKWSSALGWREGRGTISLDVGITKRTWL